MDFNTARMLSRMTLAEISNLLSLSLKTVTKYKTENKAPRAVIISLMLIGGHIPCFTQRNDFKGWSFGSGYLWSPGGDRFTSGDVLAMRTDLALIRSLRSELRQIKSKSVVKGSAQIIPFPVKFKEHKHLA